MITVLYSAFHACISVVRAFRTLRSSIREVLHQVASALAAFTESGEELSLYNDIQNDAYYALILILGGLVSLSFGCGYAFAQWQTGRDRAPLREGATTWAETPRQRRTASPSPTSHRSPQRANRPRALARSLTSPPSPAPRDFRHLQADFPVQLLSPAAPSARGVSRPP